MKLSITLLFATMIFVVKPQSQEVPVSVQLTPAFQVPPVAANRFSALVPGVQAEWAPYGENFVATFRESSSQAPRRMVFDRNGNFISRDELLVKKQYPRSVDHFFENNYPDEKYEIWQRSDSAGAKQFFASMADTIWFDRDGRYAWKRPGVAVSESDLEMFTKTAASQIMDASAAELTAVNAASPELKELALRRIEQSRKMHETLRQLAASKRLRLPTELNAQQQKKLAELRALQGKEFDREYARFIMKEDRKNKARLKSALRHTSDDATRHWLQSAVEMNASNARNSEETWCKIKRG